MGRESAPARLHRRPEDAPRGGAGDGLRWRARFPRDGAARSRLPGSGPRVARGSPAARRERDEGLRSPGRRVAPRGQADAEAPVTAGTDPPTPDPCERPGLKRGGDHAESGTDPSKSASRRNAAQDARPGSCRPRRGPSRGGAGLSGRGSGLGQRGVVRTPRQACARAAGAHSQRLTVRLADGASNGTLSGFG